MNNVQTSIFDAAATDFAPLVAAPTVPGSSIDEQFWAFHRANPHVYKLLKKLAFEMLKTREKYSISTLIEIVRWHHDVQTTGDPFKINNNYKSRYARLLMERNPELVGFFETRELRS